MKYRIAVFDDEVTELQKTEEMIQRYAKEHTEHELEISRFTELEPFMEGVCDGLKDWKCAFHILFIDINPPEGAEMESVRCLRKQGFEDIIVFISPTSEHALEAYEVEARHYLVKPVSQKEIDTAMNRAIEKLSHIKFIH